jgi:hypothetical protein
MSAPTPAESRQWLIEKGLAKEHELDLLEHAQRHVFLNKLAGVLWDRMSAAVRNGRRQEAKAEGWFTNDVHDHLNVIADAVARRLGPPPGSSESPTIL